MIQDQFATSPAGRYHGHLAVDLIRFRMSHRDNNLDGAVAFQQRAPERDWLGTD